MPKTKIVKEILTKIILRNDVLTSWEASSIILEKGEPAIVMDLEKKIAKIKIGNGKDTFSDLPYSTISPEEVREMIESSMIQGGVINFISLDSGTNNGTLKLTINNTEYDNIAVTGLGSAAYTKSEDYATAKQGENADKAIEAIELGVSAVVSGGIKGSASSTPVGKPMNIEVTEVNTDYFTQGSKILILNGGNAALETIQ